MYRLSDLDYRAMRLLNTQSMELHDSTSPPPPYSVFSYARVKGDLVYEDFKSPGILPRKAGFHRLREACSRACDRGSNWLWADAVCIDRRSSAALSEFFDSMVRIYRGCTFSLIHLDDLVPDQCVNEGMGKRLAECAWMRSLWVLPQLILPKLSFFYDRDWTEIGTKVSLARQLSYATSIDESILSNSGTLWKHCIAQRISRAFKLNASRIENRPFSLLGIMGVNVAVVYGEGRWAFIRLKEDTLRDIVNFSMVGCLPEAPGVYPGILAHPPAEFQHFQQGPKGPLRIRSEIQLTTAGIVVLGYFKQCDHDLILPLKTNEGNTHFIRLSKSGQGFMRSGHYPVIVTDWPLWKQRTLGFDTQMDPRPGEQDTDGNLQLCMSCDVTISDCNTMNVLRSANKRSEQQFLSRGDSLLSSLLEIRGHYSASPFSSHNIKDQNISNSDAFPRKASFSELIERMDQKSCSEFSVPGPESGSIGQFGRPSSCGSESEERAGTSKGECASVELEDDDFLADEVIPQGGEYTICVDDDATLEAAISTPPTLEADHPLVEAASILIDSLIKKFRSQLSHESTKQLNIVRRMPERKKIRLMYSEACVDVEQTSDLEDLGTVVPQHMNEQTKNLACPFYLWNKQRYRTCLTRHHLQNIEQVREHLWAIHQRPTFCPVCGRTFSRMEERDNHIRSRKCTPPKTTLPTFEGLTISHIRELARQAGLPMSTEKRWFRMWATIFPGAERPVSMFYSTEEESRVCALRDFWAMHKHSMVKSLQETQGCQAHPLSYQSEDLVTLCNTVLNGAIDKILQVDECV